MSKRRKPEVWFKNKAAAFARDGYKCVYCGTEKGPFVGDHIVPLSKGGSYDIDNIATACRKCNADKGAMDLAEWLSAREA